MPADLFVYAIVAAGLVFWLRSILGTRHGNERQRFNPYTGQAEETETLPPQNMSVETIINPQLQIIELSKDKNGIMSVENKTAEQGLIEIARQDKTFDIKHFLQGAQDAFAIIVEAFAEGDRETLNNLLAPDVYNAFDAAIDGREERQEKQKTDIHAIRKAEIIGARIENKTCLITVRFLAEETNVTRDIAGTIIAGHPDKISKMRDVWVFGRPLRARDPRWMVHETRGDVEGDNDIIPNTVS